MEIDLDVDNCKDVYESLERFCGVEKPEGLNQLEAKDLGFQVTGVDSAPWIASKLCATMFVSVGFLENCSL